MLNRLQMARIAIFLIHGCAIFLLFFPYPDIFSSGPILSDDYAFHSYNVYSGLQFLKFNGTFCGYDPHFMAGFLNGPVYINTIALKIFAAFLSFFHIDIWVSFKVFCLLTFLGFPILLYRAARNFGASPLIATYAFAFSVLYWHLGSLINEMVKFGMFSYVFSTAVVVYCASFIFRWFLGFRTLPGSFFIAALSGVAFLIHPFVAVSFLILGVIFFWVFRKNFRKQDFLLFCLLLLFVLGINFFWMNLYIGHSYLRAPSGPNFQSKGVLSVIGDFFYKPGYGLQSLILLLGSLGLFHFRERKYFFRFFLSAYLCFFFFAYFGSFSRVLYELQPRRFITQATLFMIIPAAYSLGFYSKYFSRFLLRQKIIVILACAMFFIPSISPNLTWFFKGNHVLSRMPDLGKEIVRFIESSTTKDGRILIQDSRDHYYFGSHFLSLLPVFTSREFIGGPATDMYDIMHEKIDFSDDIIFGREITRYSKKELSEKFRLYNIRWVLVFSEKAKKIIGSLDGARKIKDISWLTAYEFRENASYLLSGHAISVLSDFNQIYVQGITSRECILKYHWIDGLYAQGAKIVPFFDKRLSFPFIRIIPEQTSNVLIRYFPGKIPPDA